MQTLVDYFKTLNVEDANSINDDNAQINDQSGNELDDSEFSIPSAALNDPITNDEISLAIKSLKLNKSSGHDQIINEYIISTKHFVLTIYTRLFNCTLDSGIVPWIGLKAL